jgi:hypothetical protein
MWKKIRCVLWYLKWQLLRFFYQNKHLGSCKKIFSQIWMLQCSHINMLFANNWQWQFFLFKFARLSIFFFTYSVIKIVVLCHTRWFDHYDEQTLSTDNIISYVYTLMCINPFDENEVKLLLLSLMVTVIDMF